MSKIDKEFDERFVFNKASVSKDGVFITEDVHKLKKFIKDKIKEITDEMIGELKAIEYMDKRHEHYNDHVMTSQERAFGYNRKRQEIIDIRDKYLKD